MRRAPSPWGSASASGHSRRIEHRTHGLRQLVEGAPSCSERAPPTARGHRVQAVSVMRTGRVPARPVGVGRALRGHALQELVAGLLALPARLGADLAVLHPVLRVRLALVAAELARLGAGMESGPNHLRLERRLPGQDDAATIREMTTILRRALRP